MPPQTQMPLPDGRTVAMWRDAEDAQPDNLRAWDAADELALLHVADAGLLPTEAQAQRSWLVVGDAFGALQVGLAAMGVQAAAWTDSVVAQAWAGANLARNDLQERSGPMVDGTTVPTGVGVVLIRIPKAGAMLTDQLSRLSMVLPEGAIVIGVGMTRTIHSSTVAAFEQLIGPTTTTRARKKARLILATADPARRPSVPPGPLEHHVRGIEVVAEAGVFAQDRLDAGTALLLDALEPLVTEWRGRRLDAVDLGCGSGVVGTLIASWHPDAAVVFTDVSHRAIASAQQTFARAHSDRDATFHAADGLSACPDGSADLIAVNPPFHRGHEVGDQIAWAMFADARRVLRPGGHLVAVGNQHLGHHAKMQRLYANVEVLASTPAFVVLRSLRR